MSALPLPRPAALALSLAVAAAPSAVPAQEPALTDLAATAPILLPELVVTASRAPEPAARVGSAVTVIDRAEIERRQAEFVSDLLRDVPGVAVSRQGPPGAVTEVRLRGAEANHTLVMIDGVEANDPAGASQFDFAHLMTADVERIEILRGPQSALYGSDAIGGVVNIITRRGRQGHDLRGSVEGGSFRTVRGGASLSGGGDGYRYALNASQYRSDGISIAPGGDERDGYRNRTLSFSGAADLLPNLELSATGRHVDARVESDPGFPLPLDGDSVSHLDQFYGRAQAKLTLLDGRWEHIVGAGLTDTENRTRTEGEPNTRIAGQRVKYDYQTNFSFTTPDARHSVTGLAEREEEDFTFRGFQAVDRDTATHGLVGLYRLDLFDRLFLSAALRHDDNEIFKDATTWRATAAYLHAETGTRLHGSYGTGVKNPTFFELFGFDANFRGNPDLEPERSEGFDIGVEQRFGDGRYVLDVTYFEQDLKDEIVGAGATAVNQFGKSKRRGVEISGRAELLPGLDLAASYTYLRARDPEGEVEVRRPSHSASLHVNYRFLEDRASLNLGLRYNGAQDDLDFRPLFPAPPARVRLGDYLLVNLAGSYRLTDNVELYGRIENLLDEDYQDVFGFATPGIAAYLGMRVQFGL